jgi:hypothetical protein
MGPHQERDKGEALALVFSRPCAILKASEAIMRNIYGLIAIVILASCTVTSYDGSIRVVNNSSVDISNITYAGETIQEGDTVNLPAGADGEIAVSLDSGYRYTFPVIVKISIRDNYLITIYGSGEMREGTPLLYAKVQTY